MTDARIAELLGWPPDRYHRASSLIERIRLIVVEAQAEVQAEKPPVQQRRPMTGGEIARAFSAWSIIDESPHKAYIAGILDAERHHGIGDAPCWCHKCNPTSPHMIVCPECGNKRCPHASDHALACTGSNEPGQPGSVYGRITGDEA